MDPKGASIIVAVLLIIIIILLLIAYSYYPSSEYNTFHPAVDARVAQAAASRHRKHEMGASPPRKSEEIWDKWNKLQTASQRRQPQQEA